jgi:hypothetical protein
LKPSADAIDSIDGHPYQVRTRDFYCDEVHDKGLFFYITGREGERYVDESVCVLDPDVIVLRKQDCRQDGQVPVRNSGILLGMPPVVWIRADASAGDPGDRSHQQGHCSVCDSVSTALSVIHDWNRREGEMNMAY